MSRKAKRKLENLYFREDFRRVDPDHMGDMHFGSHGIENYSQAFYQTLSRECKATKPLKIVVDYAYSRLSSVFPAMLGKLSWDTIALNAYSDPKRTPRTEEDRNSLLRNLSRVVMTLEADAGVLIDADGEKLTIVDDSGRVIDGNTLTALFTTLVAAASPDSKIAVPVTAPAALEELASEYGAEIVRTKTDIRDLMSTAGESGVTLAADTDGGFISPSFHPSYDAMYAFGRMMSLASNSNAKLSELVAALPDFWVKQESVRCPWEQKGKVMRVLAEEERSSNADFTDGIKIRRGQSWALVLPDPSEPFFRIITEGSNAAEAEELAEHYMQRVTDLAA
jgi:mannose-1-phosphate guanylyltransferase/phosphomannomutase